MLKYKTNLGQLWQGDCLNIMDKFIKDEINVDLIILDPPYYSTNKKEVGDNQWKTENEYIDWCLKLFNKCQILLKENGSLYLFHNNPDLMTDILYKIKYGTSFKLKNQITWSKINNWKNANINDGAGIYRSLLQCYGSQIKYNKSLTEYIYYFTLQEDDAIYNNPNLFKDIRDYLNKERYKAKENGYGDLELRKLCGLSLKGGGMFGHFWNPKQWKLISKKYYEAIQQTGFFQMPYEDLYKMYLDELYTAKVKFNQSKKVFKNKSVLDIKEELKPFSTVWEYDRDEAYKIHLTPKPLKMIQHIIEVSSDEGDIILDCFSGSGTSSVVSENTNRRWLCIEKEPKYCDITIKRLEELK